MSLGKFDVTAYEGEPGHSRYIRLHMVVGYVCGRLSEKGVPNPLDKLDNAVAAIHDHKGTLEIAWKSAEAAFQYGRLFIDGWTQIGQEPLLEFTLPDGAVIPLHIS
ncbi:hypothetical protein [Burkholderia gladioli]|uniref:hypothetical protein n=1 Tax=Burkholderia gladioli TaxID=28095 RepID=UPI0016419AFF|nr:hypothetical protein [Burkholderia gladioli]